MFLRQCLISIFVNDLLNFGILCILFFYILYLSKLLCHHEAHGSTEKEHDEVDDNDDDALGDWQYNVLNKSLSIVRVKDVTFKRFCNYKERVVVLCSVHGAAANIIVLGKPETSPHWRQKKL